MHFISNFYAASGVRRISLNDVLSLLFQERPASPPPTSKGSKSKSIVTPHTLRALALWQYGGLESKLSEYVRSSGFILAYNPSFIYLTIIYF